MNAAGKEQYCFCLLGVGIESPTVEEGTDKIEGLLDEDAVTGHSEAGIVVKSC